jgi:hypothetical protein
MKRVESGLLYVDGDPKECDFCDNIKKCASIKWLTGDVIIICKDCLLEFVNEFEDEEC